MKKLNEINTVPFESLEEINDGFRQVQEFVHKLEKQSKYAKEQSREYDLQRDDILHAIEMGKGSLDATKLIKLTKDLQDVLLERRRYKDMMETLEKVQSKTTALTGNINKIDDVSNTVADTVVNLTKRKYKTRRCHHLVELLPNSFIAGERGAK